MKIYLLCSAALAAVATHAPALAQDRADADCAQSGDCAVTTAAEPRGDGIIVTASRQQDGVVIEDFTGSATVITARQIENRQTRNIEDVLRDVPGVAVASTPGQTQIRVRGTEANHILVLVDGIEVSDPGSGEYDLGTLQAEIGARIEVLRGPQSALYGSEAVGGVIAYDSGTYDGLGARIEFGTNTTVNGAARWGTGGDVWDVSLSAAVVSTDGEPNAREIAGNGVRDLGRDSYTLSGKANLDLGENLRLRAVGRYVRTQGDFNEQDFAFGSPTYGFVIDSPGTDFDNESLSGLIGARLELADGAWVNDVSVQYTDANRQTNQPTGFPSSTTSDRLKASYVSTYDFGGSDHAVTLAVDYELEGFNNVGTFNDRKQSETLSFVGEYRYTGELFDVTAAMRHDSNDLFDDATTFRFGAGVNLTDSLRVRAAMGTGVKNPTLSELFGCFDGVFIGNADLQPEELVSWEAGVDQSFADGAARLSVTYFNGDLENEIDTAFLPPDFVAQPFNRTSTSAQQGVEVAFAAQLGTQWDVNLAYTYLDAEEDGVTEVRRPQDTASAAVTWTAPSDKAAATLVVRYNGEATDSDFTVGFPAGVATLDDYTLVNLNARYEIARGINLFGRVENLLDETYEQVFTFVSPGRQFVAGISAEF